MWWWYDTGETPQLGTSKGDCPYQCSVVFLWWWRWWSCCNMGLILRLPRHRCSIMERWTSLRNPQICSQPYWFKSILILTVLVLQVIDLSMELINPVIEPGEVLPNVIGIEPVLAGELRDHHVVGVESTLHRPLALEDLLLHCLSLASTLPVFLGPSTSRMCNIPSRISIDWGSCSTPAR